MRTFRVFIILFVIAVMASTLLPVQAQEGPPLAEPRLQGVGERTITFVDASRAGRKLVTKVWYPAIVPEDKRALLAQASTGLRDAPPDTKGAPYPLILYSHWHTGFRTEAAPLAYHLASYGFVVAAMDHPGDTDLVPIEFVDRPLDVLFVLDQLATLATGDLVGLIDGSQVGVTGFAEGGHTALALTGAQIDPTYWADWCAKYPSAHGIVNRNLVCPGKQDTDQIAAYRSQFNPPVKAGELWPPFADKRIRAALLGEGGFGPVFGERGLALASVPTLLMAGTNDIEMPYEWDAVFVYQNLGSKDRYLLSFVDANYNFADEPGLKSIFLHFQTAFFGYYLQGKRDYGQYLTAKYVDSLKAPPGRGLVWGPYKK